MLEQLAPPVRKHVNTAYQLYRGPTFSKHFHIKKSYCYRVTFSVGYVSVWVVFCSALHGSRSLS